MLAAAFCRRTTTLASSCPRWWGSGLAVRAAEHGHFGVEVSHLAQLGDDAVDGGQQHGVAAHADLQGVAGVVDVFAGAGKVHELGGLLQLGAAVELGLDPVLHGLDVVVGGLFDGLDGVGIGFGEVGDQRVQIVTRFGRQRGKFGKAGIRQRDEPGHLDLNTAVHIAVFAHDGAQCGQRRRSGRPRERWR